MRLLPWEYAIRNLQRRPTRTCLTAAGLTLVVALIVLVVSFLRGLENSLTVAGDPQNVILFSQGMGENLEYSSIPSRTDELAASSLQSIRRRHGQPCASPELYLGTLIQAGSTSAPAMGLMRGVTPRALLVRSRLSLIKGNWPASGEVIVGRLAAAKLGVSTTEIAVGRSIIAEGRSWRISGIFSDGQSVLESEVWCRLDDLQAALKRQDLSIVLVNQQRNADPTDIDLFCKERLDLELQAIRQPDYYQLLLRDYEPIRWLAGLLMLMVAGAGVLMGLNTMYGATQNRARELATLQTIGFSRRALVLSLVQEGLVLASAASILGVGAAVALAQGATVRFTMGAFVLSVDAVCVMTGLTAGLLIGVLGALPPALSNLRNNIALGLKAV